MITITVSPRGEGKRDDEILNQISDFFDSFPQEEVAFKLLPGTYNVKDFIRVPHNVNVEGITISHNIKE